MARILLVEDEKMLARYLQLELTHEGYEVEAAFDGREGLDMALADGHDLLLLDLMLPKLSGIEICRRVRQHSDKPIIMLTAKADELYAGPLSLNMRNRSVHFGAEEVPLTKTEFDMLAYMLANPDRVLGRDELLSEVWGYSYAGDTNIVDVYVRYLRQKLDEKYGIKLLHTVRGVGYLFKYEQ